MTESIRSLYFESERSFMLYSIAQNTRSFNHDSDVDDKILSVKILSVTNIDATSL